MNGTDDGTMSLRCMEIWGGSDAFDNAISVTGLDAWIYCRPYRDARLGGDIYYVSTCGHRYIARFAVADVAGHGEDVSALSRRLRHLMLKHINTLNQSRFVRALNKEFLRMASGGKFATAILTSYYAPTHDLIVCNAGHPPPLWYRAEVKQWQFLTHDHPARKNKASNLPLGIIEPTAYHQFAVRLSKDDLVLIYSDSLIESADPGGELLGSDGLLEMVRDLNPQRPAQVKDELLSRVVARQGSDRFEDDVTLLVLHHNAAAPRRLSVGEFVTVIGKALRLVPV